MNRKNLLKVSLLIVLLVASGCTTSEHSENAELSTTNVSSTIEATTYTSSEMKSTSSINKEVNQSSSSEEDAINMTEPMWTQDKKEKLQQFMTNWGTSMNQDYIAYDPNRNVNYYGVSVPEKFLDGSVQLRVDDRPISVGWWEEGQSDFAYQIVAVYSDVETATSGDLHCYLFTISHGIPKVLIGQEKGYYEYHSMSFKETQNEELKNGFAKIYEVTNVQSQVSEVKGIGYEEAKAILIREGLPFLDDQGHRVRDGDYDFTQGGNCVFEEDGGIKLRQYTGARGFEEYTLTLTADGSIHLVWVTSTIEHGGRINVGIGLDKVVKR